MKKTYKGMKEKYKEKLEVIEKRELLEEKLKMVEV